MQTDPIFERQNFGNRMGFGEQPALLIIDFLQGFTKAEVFGGFNINSAIEETAKLLRTMRRLGVPVAHAQYLVQADGSDLGPFGLKVPNLKILTAEAPEAQFEPSVAPEPGEFIAVKKHASAFFGTMLAPWLAARRVDTLLITGCTTSGCVRASVVDASAHGLRPIVIEECVGDRAEAPHVASLFDMGQKYADVIPLAEAEAWLNSRHRSEPVAAA